MQGRRREGEKEFNSLLHHYQESIVPKIETANTPTKHKSTNYLFSDAGACNTDKKKQDYFVKVVK